MNSVAVQQKRYIKLTPSNNSPSYSSSGSQNVIRFSLSQVDAKAFLKDAKLNFSVDCYTTGTTRPIRTDDFNIDSVLGFSSFFDQIVINSRRFGTQLEMVNNLGRLQSSYMRTNLSSKMMGSNYYNLFKSVGCGKYNRLSSGLVSAPATDVMTKAMRKSLLVKTDCSIPLHTGLFLSDSVDLKKIGGIDICIYLSRNESVFFGAQVQASSNYVLSNVSLTVPLLYKSAKDIMETPKELVLDFLTWTSIYSSISSTISSTSNRLYLKGLVSSFSNFLPTNEINNILYNNYSLKNPGVKQLVILKNGARNPLEKQLIVSDTQTVVKNFYTEYPELTVDYMNAWKLYKFSNYTQVTSENMVGLVDDRTGCFNIGCNYSPESSGINVSDVLSVDLQKTTQTDYAMYSFFMNRATFILSDDGIKSM